MEGKTKCATEVSGTVFENHQEYLTLQLCLLKMLLLSNAVKGDFQTLCDRLKYIVGRRRS